MKARALISLAALAGVGLVAARQLQPRAELEDEEGGDLVDAFAGSVRATLDGIQESVEGVEVSTAEKNVAAFLQMIRAGEGTDGAVGYRALFTYHPVKNPGMLFDSFEDHPRRKITGTFKGGLTLTSTAAGAYQFLERTWDECAAALDLPDFSPASQDAAAVYLIKRRGALADVKAGRFDAAVAKCAREWASLPGSPYGQPVKTLDQARAVYEANGGSYA